MKKFEITKEQILLLAEQHSWSESKLKQWFPQAFESELEVGKWYKMPKYGDAIFCITKIQNSRCFAYGINYMGEWRDEKDFATTDSPEEFILATDKEVETALIAEAKRRGFKDAVKFNVDWEIYGKKEGIMQDSMFKLNNNSFGFQTLCQIGQPWIFCNGKWAKIISDPIELTLEQRIERIEEQLKIKK